MPGGSFVKAYGNARKLFNIGKHPIGVLTYGVGNLGKRSVEGVLQEFNATIPTSNLPVEQAAIKLYDYVREDYNQAFQVVPVAQKPAMGFLIAGYSVLTQVPAGAIKYICEEWEFVLPQDAAPKRVRAADEFGAAWRGMAVWFSRLFFGIDGRITEQLRAAGAPADLVNQLTTGLPMPIIFESMPLQDAVDFAEFVLNVTINSSRFEIGVPVCAPPLDLAVVKPEVGFKWIRRKPLEMQIEGTENR